MRFANPLYVVVLGAAMSATSLSQTFVVGEALVEPNLSGTTQNDVFTALTNPPVTGFPGFPGTGAWPNPIESNIGGDAQLIKVSNGTGGGPYPASGSIYYGGFSGAVNNNGGTLAVTDSTPVEGLANVVFQLQIGEAWTYDLYQPDAGDPDSVLPVLNYNGGSQQLRPATSLFIERFYNGTVAMPTGDEAVYINTRLLQWDLSDISDPITSFSVSFTGVQHAQLYSLRLDQSDTFTAVPEPATIGMLAATGLMALRRRRRR